MAMEETGKGNNSTNSHRLRNSPLLDLDLNFLPSSDDMSEDSEDQWNESPVLPGGYVGVIENKKRRAGKEHISKIELSDLAKYFDVPIIEASRNLNVGLTVLKRKCRELGIPRWPHRKIKSLDGLIHDLQEKAKQQEQDDKAAVAVAKRKKILESEKARIERTPVIDLQIETKKFRQDVFKRRYRARALRNQGISISSN